MNQREQIEEALESVAQGLRILDYQDVIEELPMARIQANFEFIKEVLSTPQPEASDREIAVKILDGLYCWSVGPRDDDGFRSAAENDNIVSDTEAVIVTIRADERRKVLELNNKYEDYVSDCDANDMTPESFNEWILGQ